MHHWIKNAANIPHLKEAWLVVPQVLKAMEHSQNSLLPLLKCQLRLNTDRASRRNPGNAGWGVVFRNQLGAVVGNLTLVGELGVATSYEAERTVVVGQDQAS